jgi:hypothetical protein
VIAEQEEVVMVEWLLISGMARSKIRVHYQDAALVKQVAGPSQVGAYSVGGLTRMV